MSKRSIVILPLAVVSVLLLPALALAAGVDEPAPAHTQLLPEQQFWAFVLGALSPLVGYVLNRVGPQISQPVKAAVQVAVAAAVGAAYQLLDAGSLGLDVETLQIVGTAVVGALAAHLGLYKPGNINTRLGGYLSGQPADAPVGAAKPAA